jgi:hypothetical protein
MSRKKGRGFRGERRQETSVDRGGQLSFSGAKEDSVLPITASNDEAKPIDIDSVIGTGWSHTHGMAARGYPEVEVRGVPDFLAESAAALIQRVCNYMLEQAVCIKPGETMATSPRTRFRLIKAEPFPGAEDHYTVERLQIVDVEHVCECCGMRESQRD